MEFKLGDKSKQSSLQQNSLNWAEKSPDWAFGSVS
jgi:hypothetical protein